MGKELLHLFIYSFLILFSLICLYRNRDILVNVLKRKAREGKKRGEIKGRLGEERNNEKSCAALNLLIHPPLRVSSVARFFSCGISCTVAALVKLIRLIRYGNH